MCQRTRGPQCPTRNQLGINLAQSQLGVGASGHFQDLVGGAAEGLPRAFDSGAERGFGS